MDMSLIRNAYRVDGIFGEMKSADESFKCVTLEHSYPISADGLTSPSTTYLPIIEPGIYKCIRRKSFHFGYEVFEVTNVKGHDNIEIHIGCYNKDSKGCILVGHEIAQSDLDRTVQMIRLSARTFEAFMKLQEGVDIFTLTVA